jgi:hypothetical protein
MSLKILTLFADHWENPEGFEAAFRKNPHAILRSYGVFVSPLVEIILTVNAPRRLNVRVLLDLEFRRDLWSFSHKACASLFSFMYCPIRDWCGGGLAEATPAFEKIQKRCREDPAYLTRFCDEPRAELALYGMPIPEEYELHIHVSDRYHQIINLPSPKGTRAAQELRTIIDRGEQAHAAVD